MKYVISGYVLFGSGLTLILSFFIVMLPMLSGMGGTSIVFFFPIFFLVFLLGVLEIICGLLNLIKQKFYKRLSIISGVLSLLMGLLYLMLYFWWLVLVLFISGIFLLYLGSTKSWK